jgi:excinuclease ABC subunit A
VKGFFNWLESKTYKMHIRVLLSRYRSYQPCPKCRGARLQPEALNFRMEPTHKTLPEVRRLRSATLRGFLRPASGGRPTLFCHQCFPVALHERG